MNALSADINGDKKYTVISLFAGCGGSSLGYKKTVKVVKVYMLLALSWL